MASPAASLRKGYRYPPLFAIVLVALFVAAILPSALNLPQTNPATTLEYAPVPPDDERTEPPPGGNHSSLGLPTGSGLDVQPPLPPSAPPLLGTGERPTTKRCVGSPPRQTEDLLSPPCVAHFDGDNFAATYQGVTRDEIRIVYYLPGDVITTSSTPGVAPQTGRVIDLAQPPGANEHVYIRSLRVWQRYFNDRYQTYDRRVHFYVYFRAGADSTAEEVRAEAAQIYNAVKPFAFFSSVLGGNEHIAITEMARRNVLSFSSLGARDESFFKKYPGRIWSYDPSVQILARQFSSYVCRKVVGKPVSFGNVGRGGTRRLGLLYVNTSTAPELRMIAELVKRQITDCGGEFVTERSFTAFGRAANAFDLSGPSTANQNMAAFAQRRVTTIIRAPGWDIAHSQAAGRINYFPEWVAMGDNKTMEGSAGSSRQDQSVWRNAWVVTSAVRVGNANDTACHTAVRDADPSFPQSDTGVACSSGGIGNFYDDLRQFFTGVQVAGPRLTPASMDEGFHAIPSIQSTDPYIPACFYEPGDYTCVKDATVQWWDAGRGCYRMPQDGRRYLIGKWPPGDVTAQRSSADPCNNFAGSFYAF